jgi:hypothetical protein
MTEVPRGLEIVAHDDKGLPPLGRKWISPQRANERQGRHLSRIVAGEVPLDDSAAEVVRAYLEAHHAKQ